MVVGPVRDVRDLADTASTVPPALLSASQSFEWTLCGIYQPLNGNTDTTLYASELDPDTEAVWVLPDMAARHRYTRRLYK